MFGSGPRPALLAVLVAALALGCDDAPGQEQRADQRGLERARRMLQLADICEHGAGDLAQVCTDACEIGHSNSCYMAGALRRSSAPSEALALYTRACTGGSGLGCEAAARARWVGAGAPRDPAAAARLDRGARFYLRVHCEQNHARSCQVLGRLFTTTRGGPPDAGFSAVFRERACTLGLAEACGVPSAPF